MSFDIDMKSFAGDTGPAAGDQQVVDTNSYGEVEEFPIQEDLLNSESSTEASASPASSDQIPEPLSKQELNFKALREEVDRIKAERDQKERELQLQIEMLKANSQKPSQPEEKYFRGMSGDDIPSVDDYRKEMNHLERSYQTRLQEMEFQLSHPDYAEVLNKYLTPLAKEKPTLVDAIKHHPNPHEYAYELAKMAQTMQSQPPVQPPMSNNAQRIVDNARKPGTLSQAGGQSALSKADYIASMSDSEFAKFASKFFD